MLFRSGFVVPVANSLKLALAVNYLLKNNELTYQFGYANRKKVENEFTMGKIGMRILNLYKSLI